MSRVDFERVIGYYLSENVIVPLFEELALEEFSVRYPGKVPLLAGDLADDEEYVPDIDGEEDEMG